MSIEIALNTPLADALNSVIQPKLMEVGWAQSNDDAALSEYIILMLVNGKTQEQIAGELAGDLLSLGPDDPAARDFTHWLFDQINALQSQLNGGLAHAGNSAEGGVLTDAVPMEQDTEMSTSTDGPELNAPTGPKSMRNGNMRGGREKRMFGQMAKAMDRSHDSVLHRVRGNGNERINAHNRGPPSGPRLGRGNNRMMNNRAAGISAGLNQMANSMPGMAGPPNMNGMNDMSWMMQSGPQQEQIFQLLQQQNQMMAQLQQQLSQQNQNNNGRPGRSLFDRTQNPRGGRRGGHHMNGPRSLHTGSPKPPDNNAEGEDVDMSQGKPEPPNPETTICKFNLACTNKECKFAHQSPAAPPNTTVDVTDVCSFGAACKNWKCVGRHPSPATKRAHQNEQECKFYPNCTNPHCPFKHPDMPPCRNGGDCNVEGCKFTHLQTMCKFKPCKNRYCPFKHEEGQRGTFPDKVWTTEGAKNHVSERHFIDQNGAEELIIPGSCRCIRAMIPKRPEDAFIILLRSLYNNAQRSTQRLATRRPTTLLGRPHLSARLLSTLSGSRSRPETSIGSSLAYRGQKQPYATTSTGQTEPRQIAILGAGITGLTAAHYLARHAENAHITIYEATDRPGGWIKANRVEVEDDNGNKGHVLLQNGPRMLRSGSSSTKYDDLVLYDVLASLNMGDQIRHPEGVSDSRYLYYPDHLVKMPSGERSLDNLVGAIQSYLSEPIWSGGLRTAFNFWVSYNKSLAPSHRHHPNTSHEVPETDESVTQFLKRILKDDRFINNIVSGIMHGIYGGDINKLSAKHTILDRLWYHFQNPLPPDMKASWVDLKEWYLLFDMLSGPNRLKIIELAEKAIDWKLLAFEDGLVSLVRGLEEDLKKRSNVTFSYNKTITSLKHENGKILVTKSNSNKPAQHDHVICTLFSKKLAQITEPQNSLPSLAETHAVTIMVVNLWYPNPNLLAEHGFGYLIPSSTPENEEGALGVLFDSDLRTDDNEMPGTKLTVMLGGHHWDGWEYFPSEEAGIAMAKEVVRRQLGINSDERVVASTRLCRDCLPQHFVGHRDRMKEAHYELLSAFQGHLSVAGPSYTTIGVIPSMRAGFDAAMRVARGHGQPWFRIPERNRITLDNLSPESPENDYWLPNDASPTKIDTIGDTGLEHFTEKEWANLRPSVRDGMLFRKFTGKPARFLDPNVQQRPVT
ncbi:hypothetical protein F5B22DRAFT_636584 [Xylaria bambusicola]|uniref:uncharacterized protein n=1 Tax=Xylaria bambusicola TaxID=326684 RepID=UPI00200799C3|nr:uncharacterized protein F5B22DRAFT_636584 [Xylaria bambusicola]KAI0515301.1 hypothetical protein F5B22DRAFT_636584 [Xylaria bambusicola]